MSWYCPGPWSRGWLSRWQCQHCWQGWWRHLPDSSNFNNECKPCSVNLNALVIIFTQHTHILFSFGIHIHTPETTNTFYSWAMFVRQFALCSAILLFYSAILIFKWHFVWQFRSFTRQFLNSNDYLTMKKGITGKTTTISFLPWYSRLKDCC